MPLGKTTTATGKSIDYDAIYQNLIAPAILAANLQPLRATEDPAELAISKPLSEQLILCEFAVAELSTANATVYHALGMRQALRPSTTLLLCAKDTGQAPYHPAGPEVIPYPLDADGKPSAVAALSKIITSQLSEARKNSPASPIYHSVAAFSGIQRLKTDVFREQVQYCASVKKSLAEARQQGLAAVKAVAQQLRQQTKLANTESGSVIDLYLSYRAVKGWQEMIALVAEMAPPLANTVLVQEQLGMALNRAGRGHEAETVLTRVLQTHGPSSETYSILGRVYKDRWQAAHTRGEQAHGYLNQAIETYLKGFEADWRDAYPGINAVTLMELAEPIDARQSKLLPIVSYAIERRIAAGKPDYWDYASRLEFAVLTRDKDSAYKALTEALVMIREKWEPEATVRNLHLIRQANTQRGKNCQWLGDIIEKLEKY